MKIKKENFSGMTRRDFLYLSGAGMAGITLAGRPEWGYGAERKPKYGGRIRIGVRFAADGLDAHKNQVYAAIKYYGLMYHGLTEQGKMPDVEIYPMLAKSWEISSDGREYIFPLREGVKFHHGKELDSGDIKYSIDRIMNPATRSPRAFSFRWVDSVDVIDKYHVRIKLKEAFAPFLTVLTVNFCPIIPAGWEPTGMKPAPGTGPFPLKSFVSNETAEFTRFDQFWELDEKTGDRLPYADAVYMKKIPEEIVRLTALRAGDLDFIESPPMHILAKALLEKPIPGMTMGYMFAGNDVIFFNVSKPPFDNKKVRQAVAYALDKKELVKALYWGLGRVSTQPFLPESRFYIPVPEREVNLAKAKQLLAEAGYPDGFETEILEYSVTKYVAGGELLIGQLQKIGIRATMKVVDRAPYFVMLRKGEYSISYSGYDERYDWDDAYYMYFHSKEIGKNNWSRYSNKELDELVEKGRITMKVEERKQIYKRVIEILSEDLPAWYSSKNITAYAFRDNLKGYREGFATRYAFWGGGIKYWWLDK